MTTLEQPCPPFDEQPLEQPGVESALAPRPRYRAPEYRGSGTTAG